MAGYEASIAVWIPLIVGLAPGLVYWFAITGMRKRRISSIKIFLLILFFLNSILLHKFEYFTKSESLSKTNHHYT